MAAKTDGLALGFDWLFLTLAAAVRVWIQPVSYRLPSGQEQKQGGRLTGQGGREQKQGGRLIGQGGQV